MKEYNMRVEISGYDVIKTTAIQDAAVGDMEFSKGEQMETKREMVRTALTPTERAELAFDVYMRIYEATESFDAGNIGSDLAYLMGAILSPQATFVQRGKCEEQFVLKILRRKYSPEHRVWSFIEVDAD